MGVKEEKKQRLRNCSKIKSTIICMTKLFSETVKEGEQWILGKVNEFNLD